MFYMAPKFPNKINGREILNSKFLVFFSLAICRRILVSVFWYNESRLTFAGKCKSAPRPHGSCDKDPSTLTVQILLVSRYNSIEGMKELMIFLKGNSTRQ